MIRKFRGIRITSNPGAYAALIGSGVSAGAGIPTGWQVVLDLISQLARVLGDDPGTDLGAGYQEGFGEESDYSKLLDALAKSPAERSALLRSYFEPTAEDRSRGIKVPGAAHMPRGRTGGHGAHPSVCHDQLRSPHLTGTRGCRSKPQGPEHARFHLGVATSFRSRMHGTKTARRLLGYKDQEYAHRAGFLR